MTPSVRTRHDPDEDEVSSRDAPDTQAVPADQWTWAGAQTAGFFGHRTDPNDDAIYGVKGSIPATTMSAVAPATQAHGVAGAWTVTATGTFYVPDPVGWHLTLQGHDGVDLRSTSIAEVSPTSLTATYSGGLAATAVGAGFAELKHGNTIVAQLPFTWT